MFIQIQIILVCFTPEIDQKYEEIIFNLLPV